jgi:hypothetical protein
MINNSERDMKLDEIQIKTEKMAKEVNSNFHTKKIKKVPVVEEPTPEEP